MSEEVDDVVSAGNIDGPEHFDRAKLVDGVPVTLVDAPQADVMGDFGVAIFKTVPFSG